MGGQFEDNVKWDRIPQHMREHIRAYVEECRPVGHFLTALLSNDLKNAALRADDENRAALADWAEFLYEYAPSNCWGSPEIVAAWLAVEDVRTHDGGAVIPMAQGVRRLSIRAGAMEETLRLMGEDVDTARDIAQQLADRFAELKRIIKMAEQGE